jgi:hypothetical protein
MSWQIKPHRPLVFACYLSFKYILDEEEQEAKKKISLKMLKIFARI